MNSSHKIKSLTAAILLATGVNDVFALPYTANVSAANTLYISGGAAQDVAFDGFVEALAIPGTFDVYYDGLSGTAGSKYRAYFFQSTSNLIPGLSGGGQPVNILIYKRSYGAAGYGVVPLLSNDYQVKQPDIRKAGVVAATKQGSEKYWRFDASAANLVGTISDAGISGLNPELYYGINEPTAVVEDEEFPPLDVTKAAEKLDIRPIGGLTYGLAVTLDLYKVLQAAQKATGTLPSDTVIGDYSKESSIPTLSRNFVASLITGKIKKWDDIEVIDDRGFANGDTAGTSKGKLTDFATVAGVNPPSSTIVALANRNKGAAIGAAFNAFFLNSPGTQNANNPATSPGDAINGPKVIQAPGAGQVDDALDAWQKGTAGSYTSAGGTLWGIGQQSIDRNTSGAIGTNPTKYQHRYVRIDGYAGTLPNVASGNYPLWTEQTIQWRLPENNGPTGDKLAILEKLATDIASPSAARAVNAKTVNTFGPTGVFAVSTNPAITSNAPFNTNAPVVNYTYLNAGKVNNAIVPAFNAANPGSITFK